jgi:hypothetical protein
MLSRKTKTSWHILIYIVSDVSSANLVANMRTVNLPPSATNLFLLPFEQ